tara:strand:+ start:1124 stop:1309 length:186 start_codon:yes stop_codon:yes gene_type:complete
MKFHLLLLILAYIPAIAFYRYAKALANQPLINPSIETEIRHTRSSNHTINGWEDPLRISEK